MAEHVIKLPDVGEGVAEAELVEWHVKVGDLVREDAVLAAVMTDKATVEIPSPVDGEISWLGAEIGDTVPVGSPIVRIRIGGAARSLEPVAEGDAAAVTGDETSGLMDDGETESPVADGLAEGGETVPPPPPAKVEKARQAQHAASARAPADSIVAPRAVGEKPLASPAVRQRAREAGVDLRQVHGSGPAARIGHDDLDAFLEGGSKHQGAGVLQARNGVEEIKIVGLRRKIAEKMAISASRIPHITYVEEIDVTALEDLRAALNKEARKGRPKLTILPFLMRAMVKAIGEQPGINALYDDESGILRRHAAVHLGIATQTPSDLMVPVVRHAETRDIWDCASEVARLADAAKAGTASRDELSGSTITITSLGAMGGVVTTPIINHPEVAIVGVNKIMMRPVWDGAQFVPRKMMNLSSSFDHRVVDGWDAAVFVQRIKALIETPALIFVEG